LDYTFGWICQPDCLFLLSTTADVWLFVGDIGMNRLYHICFDVVRQDDLLEVNPHRVKSYVAAECPYQARFLVKSRLHSTPWVSLGSRESWEIVETSHFDISVHRPEDVMDAMDFGLVVVNVESYEQPDRHLALPA
jgi:hypothetical protein